MNHLAQAIICLEVSARSGRWPIRRFVQPLRNNNLSVYVSRCKQLSNQSQPIVILMLVRLNGKSVYRSFLSLFPHTRTLSFSFTSSIGPNEQFDLKPDTLLYSFSFLRLFFFNYLQPTLNGRQTTFKSSFFLLDGNSSKCFRGQQDVSSIRDRNHRKHDWEIDP